MSSIPTCNQANKEDCQFPIESSPQKFHVVQEGDTLWDIAQQNVGDDDSGSKPDAYETNAEVGRLAKINGIKDPNVIKPGQKIFFSD